MSLSSWELSLWSSTDDTCASGMSRRMHISSFLGQTASIQPVIDGRMWTHCLKSQLYFSHVSQLLCCNMFLRGFYLFGVLFLNLKKNALCTLGATLSLSWGAQETSETFRTRLDWKLSRDETCMSWQGPGLQCHVRHRWLSNLQPNCSCQGTKGKLFAFKQTGAKVCEYCFWELG